LDTEHNVNDEVTEYPVKSTYSVPDEGYSRNAPRALHLISTFSLTFNERGMEAFSHLYWTD